MPVGVGYTFGKGLQKLGMKKGSITMGKSIARNMLPGAFMGATYGALSSETSIAGGAFQGAALGGIIGGIKGHNLINNFSKRGRGLINRGRARNARNFRNMKAAITSRKEIARIESMRPKEIPGYTPKSNPRPNYLPNTQYTF